MIAVISDTHENVSLIRKAVTLIRSANVDLVVHCGDIISPAVLEEFKGLPLKFVFGNNDGEIVGLTEKAKEFGFTKPDVFLDFEHCGKRFFVYHKDNSKIVEDKIGSQVYDYILVGHTHIRKDERVFNTHIINPGAFIFATPPSFAFLDLKKDKVEFVDL